MPEDNLFGALGSGPRDIKHLIDNAEECVKRRLDGVSPVDGNVPVQDFLQDLGISYEALAVVDQFFK